MRGRARVGVFFVIAHFFFLSASERAFERESVFECSHVCLCVSVFVCMHVKVCA